MLVFSYGKVTEYMFQKIACGITSKYEGALTSV